jgi:hypothetical protein
MFHPYPMWKFIQGNDRSKSKFYQARHGSTLNKKEPINQGSRQQQPLVTLLTFRTAERPTRRRTPPPPISSSHPPTSTPPQAKQPSSSVLYITRRLATSPENSPHEPIPLPLPLSFSLSPLLRPCARRCFRRGVQWRTGANWWLVSGRC